MPKIEVGPFLNEESATWTKSDWEHYRLVSMAMQLEAQKIDIGWLVKTARKQLGYSQRQLANLSHVQQAEISKIEKQWAEDAQAAVDAVKKAGPGLSNVMMVRARAACACASGSARSS